MVSIQIDDKSCTGCGLCVELCPLSVADHGPLQVGDRGCHL
ncbi:MAG: 4Fe-4S binding protein [Deltaproteobacteria bacterium]|nr:4Fe-4S binding protein [Deltaproteobacteria bacterium]